MVTPRAAAPIESAVAGSQPALIESAIVKSAESTLPETGKAAAYEPQLPPFTKAGFLPPGTHSVTWQEFVDRYGWNDKRVNLLDGMRSLFGELKKQGGGDEVYVGGSFVTTKELPNDFDATWDVSGPQLGELGKKAAILSDRTLQAKTYGGQLMANYPNSPDGGILSWLQRSRTGTEIGVVKLDLSTLPIN